MCIIYIYICRNASQLYLVKSPFCCFYSFHVSVLLCHCQLMASQRVWWLLVPSRFLSDRAGKSGKILFRLASKLRNTAISGLVKIGKMMTSMTSPGIFHGIFQFPSSRTFQVSAGRRNSAPYLPFIAHVHRFRGLHGGSCCWLFFSKRLGKTPDKSMKIPWNWSI